MRVPCHLARRVAQRWTAAADAGAPPARLRGLMCTTTQQPYDLTVVACGSHSAPCPRDVAFVWRDPARAPAPAADPQALAAPGAGAPPEDDPGAGDEGSAAAHAA
jgi:hypothetical protein